MPYWHVAAGRVCLAPADGGAATTLRSLRGGRFELVSEERPGEMIEDAVATDRARCGTS
jgi:hypothetical protein